MIGRLRDEALGHRWSDASEAGKKPFCIIIFARVELVLRYCPGCLLTYINYKEVLTIDLNEGGLPQEHKEVKKRPIWLSQPNQGDYLYLSAT